MARVGVAAPYGGLNVLADPDALQPPDAIRCVNFIPRIGGLELRLGTQWRASPGGGTAVETLAPHSNGTILAAYGTSINARTASGVWPSVATVGGKTNAQWNYTQFQDLLILCNGADTPTTWNGTAFGLTVITGVTASTLIGCQTFKGRVYYWQANARDFWYAAAGSYQGALTRFALAQFTYRDGQLLFAVPMTFDGGSGPDDMLAFVFSNGEVLLYQGDDPGNANSWEQVGRYNIPQPRGRRAWTQSGSTTIVATVSGPVDLQKALSAGPVDISATISPKISGNVAVLPDSYSRIELLQVQDQRLLFQVKYDITSAATEVLAMDIDSRAWCLVSGWSGDASAFAVSGGSLIIGDTGGHLYAYGNLDSDQVGQGQFSAVSFTAYALSAYMDLGDDSVRKQVTGMSVYLDGMTSNFFSQRVGISTDVQDTSRTAIGGDSPTVVKSVTAADLSSPEKWVSINANGFTIAVYLELTTSGLALAAPQTRWAKTNLMVRTGGPL